MEFTRQEIFDLIWKESVTKVSEKLGIPTQILRKYCQRLNIPTPTSAYWSKLKFGKPVEVPALPEFDEEYISLDSFHNSILAKNQKSVKPNRESRKKDTSEKEKSSNEFKTTEIIPTKTKYEIQEITDPRQKIKFELNNLDPTLFVVPEVLYAKDPLIIDTKEFFRGDKNSKYLDKNPYKSKIKAPLNISVHQDNLDRALRIYTTIIRLLKLRGHQIVAKDRFHTYAIVNEEEIPIHLSEKNKQIANTESDYPKYVLVPSGKLKFEIPISIYYRSSPICVEDTSNTKIEDKILNIILKIEYEAISIKEFRAEQERRRQREEEERKKREEEEKKKRELEKRRKEEMKELRAAIVSAKCYSLANILRDYREKYESFLAEKEFMNDEDKKKLHWLLKKIDWLDPFIECDDKLLTEEDKQSLIHPETDKKDNRMTYHLFYEMPQEFTFWNNPFRRK